MQFPIQLNILDFVFHGILIGIMASAPMGPVGVLCIQRTLNKGRWYGFVTGIGACVSDFIYALFTGVGMSFVMDFVSNERTRFLLQISGSIVLLFFGIYCYRSNPTKNIHKSAKPQKGTLMHNGITAFLVTLSNPLIIFLFIFLFAQFAFVVPKDSSDSENVSREIYELCRTSLLPYAIPAKLHICSVEDIDRTPLGKIAYGVLEKKAKSLMNS